MRPLGTFSKLLIALALLVAALLFLDLTAVRGPETRHLYANSLDFCIVIVAVLASFSAARRSQGYARQLWTLLTIALALEALAEAVTTYYQSYVPGSSNLPVPSDILFFVWAAPVFCGPAEPARGCTVPGETMPALFPPRDLAKRHGPEASAEQCGG